MPEELIMQVRWPIADLEELARKKYGLREKLTDFRVEGDTLVLYFARSPSLVATPLPFSNHPAVKKNVPGPQPPEPSRRRRKGKRNRMKTRGWAVVGKMVNSRGMTATIYKPFVDALKAGDLSPAEQRAVVARILRSNGNRPEDGSVEYYLGNTLEFLAQQSQREQ